jgi:ATP-dependent 26S proteasome regulatory subunit
LPRASHASSRQAAPTSPFSDGTWCNPTAFKALTNEVCALSADAAGWWANAPQPFVSTLCDEDRCVVSIFSIPDGGRVLLRKHPVGTVIVHRALTGAFELSRWQLPSREGQRPLRVMRRECGSEDEAPLATFGGLAQQLEARRGGACAVLEIALLSPVAPVKGGRAVECFGGDPTSEAYEPGGADAMGELSAMPVDQLLFRIRRTVDGEPDDADDDADGDAAGGGGAAGGGPRKSPLERLAASVGGLAEELAAIDRRLLAPRAQSADVLRALGVAVPKGLLLHGPPGCGKTLIAREIASALGAATVQVVSGPEMMSRYVGESERWVRELFGPAEREAAEIEAGGPKVRAALSGRLHVLILDELDAFARERGSLVGDPGIRDSIVNTLLAKMDGVTALTNLLVIGTTNRIELIDRALLRPGRFEVHMRVRPPDAAGRAEILAIHTATMAAEGLLDADAAAGLAALAAATDGFTGADLAGVVRSASSHALARATGHAKPAVSRADLERARDEVGTQTQAVRDRRALAARACPTHAWDVDAVCAWLRTAGVATAAAAHFRAEAIDGRSLCALARLDGALQERLLTDSLRIEPLGERLRFLHALGDLMAQPAGFDEDARAETAVASPDDSLLKGE